MGCCDSIAKIIVYIANFVFALAGIALMVVGILYKLHINKITSAIPDGYNVDLFPTLTIVAGAIIFAISFFGCCGVQQENACLLTTYAAILLLIFFLQIALGVYVFVEFKDKNEFKTKVVNSMTEAFNKCHQQEKLCETVNFIQKEIKCCGTTGPSFWDGEVPKSCLDSNGQPYVDGCQDGFFNLIDNSMKTIGITVLGISATEVIGAILSLCLANHMRNNIRRSFYS